MSDDAPHQVVPQFGYLGQLLIAFCCPVHGEVERGRYVDMKSLLEHGRRIEREHLPCERDITTRVVSDVSPWAGEENTMIGDAPDPQRQEDLVLTLVTAAGDAGMALDVLTEAAELSDVWSDGIVTTLQRAGKVLLIPDADPVDPGLFEVRWRVVAVDRGTP